MIFWNISTVKLLMLASIKLLRVRWRPKHRRLSHRKFFSGGNTWKTMEIWVFKIMLKSCMVAMATYMRDDWWNWIFWMENYQKEESWSRNSKLQAVLKKLCEFGKAPQCTSGLDRVKLSLSFSNLGQNFMKAFQPKWILTCSISFTRFNFSFWVQGIRQCFGVSQCLSSN